MDDTDTLGFMVVPVRVNVAGELTKSEEVSAVYVLPKQTSNVATSVKHGDQEWLMAIDIAKRV